MAEYTENLNLIKPAQDEQYNVDDFNDNFDKIDDFAGLVPPRALTADKLTTGAKINGVNFKGDTDIITGLGLYSDTNTYDNTNLAYLYDNNSKLRIFQSLQNENIGHNPLTNSVYWKEIQIGQKRNLGEIVTSSLPLVDEQLHLADGSLLSSVDYPELLSRISSIYSSTLQWSESEYISNLGDRIWQAIEYFNSQYIAISYDGYISTSQDGTNWSPAQQNSNLGNNNWFILIKSTNLLLAISRTRYVSTSSDGINWSQAVRINNLLYDKISATFDGTNFVLIDGSLRAYQTSIDGINWSNTIQSLPSMSRGAITYDGENYVIVDSDGKVYKSTDLTNWTQTAFIDKNCLNINYDGSNYRILANDSVYISNNLSNWNLELSITGYSYRDMAFNGNDGVIIDESGYIITKIELPDAPFATEISWQRTYTTYGECGKYVYNPQANTLRIPLYNSYFTNTVNSQKLGELTPASIPNIKAVVAASETLYKSGTSVSDYGAFNNYAQNVVSGQSDNTHFDNDLWNFDASRVSSVYSDTATTVNTQSIKQLVYIVVKA